MRTIYKPPLIIIMLSLALPFSGSRSLAQVDAIPDPHQDFYQKQSVPRSSGVSRAAQPPAQAPTPGSGLDQAPQPGSSGSNHSTNPTINTTGSAAPAAPNDLTDVMGETAPVAPVDGQIKNSIPINTPLTHPELLPRPPIPTPPAVTLLAPMNGGHIKDPLAWRTRAYKLRSEGADTKTGLIKGSRLVNANFDDTLAALTTVCTSQGIVIDSIFESAGQVLAHPNDGNAEKSRIIFSVKPVTRNSTLVRIGLDADNHVKQTSFDDLLNRIETTVNEKGVL